MTELEVLGCLAVSSPCTGQAALPRGRMWGRGSLRYSFPERCSAEPWPGLVVKIVADTGHDETPHARTMETECRGVRPMAGRASRHPGRRWAGRRQRDGWRAIGEHGAEAAGER